MTYVMSKHVCKLKNVVPLKRMIKKFKNIRTLQISAYFALAKVCSLISTKRTFLSEKYAV